MNAQPMHDTLDQAYQSVLGAVLAHGAESSPRGMRTREVLHASFTLRNAYFNLVANPARKLSQAYAVAEFLWILLGRRDVRTLAAFNKNVAAFSDDGETFYGAYGPWVVAQLPHVVQSLRADPDSRQAVITIWQQSPPKTKDVPCTVALQFLLRAGRLHAQTFMRSNDAWLGLPYDVFTFTRIQAFVAAALGVEAGLYTHTVGSLHLYERDWAKAEAARDAVIPGDPRTGLPFFSPRLATPCPATAIGRAFEKVAAMTRDSAPLWEYLPEPWDSYVAVLAHKKTGARDFLSAPYDALLPHAPACLKSGERMIQPAEGLTPCTCARAAA